LTYLIKQAGLFFLIYFCKNLLQIFEIGEPGKDPILEFSDSVVVEEESVQVSEVAKRASRNCLDLVESQISAKTNKK
jgi:hypothetical protein